ncbi:hypothetical protein [Vibrio phage vB_ValS_PJ32]|nr:hypothetical protein [Vibrio phage vB_ValS_PJ32]
MPSIRVKRFDGTKDGEPIIEILAAEEAALIQRGRNELDDQAEDKIERTFEVPYNTAIDLLVFASVHDVEKGVTYKGRVVSVTHSFSLPEAITTFVMETLT